jgi:hypothetical protein
MGPLPPLVPRPPPHQPAARRRGTVHRQAPCPAVSCRWAAAYPGAALGAWRVSPGAARAPSQASARPRPPGRARRPSRSAPTTTGSSRTPSGTSRTLAVPSTRHTTSRADPLRPNAATGPLRHALAPGPVPHTDRQRGAALQYTARCPPGPPARSWAAKAGGQSHKTQDAVIRPPLWKPSHRPAPPRQHVMVMCPLCWALPGTSCQRGPVAVTWRGPGACDLGLVKRRGSSWRGAQPSCVGVTTARSPAVSGYL